MKITRKCAGCGQSIRVEEMTQYSSITGKTSKWYCHPCLEERLARERFSTKVCTVFGLKTPGPRIWTERKRLQIKYGYTDDSIVDCLDYIYNVLHKDKLAESLALVGPQYMAEMKQYKAMQKGTAGGIAAAIANTETKEYIVPVQVKKKEKKEINLDDGLFDD